MDKMVGEFNAAATMAVDGVGGNNNGVDSAGGCPNAVTADVASTEMCVHMKHPEWVELAWLR
jgi:hypothetical protein